MLRRYLWDPREGGVQRGKRAPLKDGGKDRNRVEWACAPSQGSHIPAMMSREGKHVPLTPWRMPVVACLGEASSVKLINVEIDIFAGCLLHVILTLSPGRLHHASGELPPWTLKPQPIPWCSRVSGCLSAPDSQKRHGARRPASCQLHNILSTFREVPQASPEPLPLLP